MEPCKHSQDDLEDAACDHLAAAGLDPGRQVGRRAGGSPLLTAPLSAPERETQPCLPQTEEGADASLPCPLLALGLLPVDSSLHHDPRPAQHNTLASGGAGTHWGKGQSRLSGSSITPSLSPLGTAHRGGAWMRQRQCSLRPSQTTDVYSWLWMMLGDLPHAVCCPGDLPHATCCPGCLPQASEC